VSAAPPVVARNLQKRFGELVAVDGIDFSVERGETFGFLGPNGAGKTSTMRMIGAVSPRGGGELTIFDLDPETDGARIRQRLGVVPQEDNLDLELTVFENLLVYGRYFGLPDATIRARLPELLEFAGLAGRAASRIQTLSGGMRRRLMLARALVNDPELVFMDEPTTGLDPQARHVIWDRLRQLLAREKTILLTTHFMEEAERLCDRIAIMDRGRFIAEGTPRELIARHIEPHVVEVHGDGLDAWAATGTRLCSRLERSGETAFCYTADAAPLIASLERASGLRYLHRAANLEDVFLKLTGRELRD